MQSTRRQQAGHLGEAFHRLVEIHDLDDGQIIEGAHHAGQHADHRERVEPGFDGGEEHVELGEEAGERRNAGEREQQHRQEERHGRRRARKAGEIADVFHEHAIASHAQNTSECAERHRYIDRHVDEHALHALGGAGGQADQREAHVADRGIGHQPLDVALADGSEGAERHRGDRDEHHDLLPLVRDAGKSDHGCAHEDGDAGNFRRGGEEGCHRRRRAFIDVGRPHVERHRRNLEAEADEHKHQAEDQPEIGALVGRLGDPGKTDGAGETVDQRRAVQQHARRQRAQHEIFQSGFGRFHVVAVRGGHHIKRQTHHLEPEIKRDQIVCRYQQHHAERRQKEQHAVFEFLLVLDREPVDRQDQCAARTGERQSLRKRA